MITIWKVRALLIQRAVAVDEDRDFRLQDNSDGAGTFIAEWDVAKLGAKPIEAQLDVFQTEADVLQEAKAAAITLTAEELTAHLKAKNMLTDSEVVAIKAAR